MLDKQKNEFTISILQKLRDKGLANRAKPGTQLPVPDAIFAEGTDPQPSTFADDLQNVEDSPDADMSSPDQRKKKLQAAFQSLRRP